MAITANMTTSEGISLTNAYCYIPITYVKKFDGEWKITTPLITDDDGKVTQEEVWTKSEATYQLIYDVFIYVDKAKRDDRNNHAYKIKNAHVDHFKIQYDVTTNGNPLALAYADLKSNENLSNVKDV